MAAVMLVDVSHASRHYDGLIAVDDVSFQIAEGEVRAIIGPNGAGKTTMVGMISGRISPSSGKIAFAGEDITRLPSWSRVMRGIVYTFQVTSIYRNLTCHENVALAAQRRNSGASAINAQAAHALSRVGLATDAKRKAGFLPYGHQRLLEVAMALALEPKLLILDEPTQGVDVGAKAEIHKIIRALAKDGLAVLMISSDLPEILGMSDRIAVMRGGELTAILPGGSDAHAVMGAALGKEAA